MHKDDPVLEWTEIAETDFLVARSFLRKPERFRHVICFDAQQSAEKYLKAILIRLNVDFPKTHDLFAINELLARHGVITGFEVRLLADLTAHAVKTRYVGDPIPLEEAKEAVETAKLVRKFRRKHLGLS